jgi:hypothetical protein
VRVSDKEAANRLVVGGWFYFESVLVRFEIKKGLPSRGEGAIIKVS